VFRYPQNFLKQFPIFGGAPVRDRLVGFGNKVAPVGAPQGKTKSGFPHPLMGEIWEVKLFSFPTPLSKTLGQIPRF